MGVPCSNILCTSSLLPLYPWGPIFRDTVFPTLFITMEPDINRFKNQPIFGVLVSILECISTHLFHPVKIRAKLACFCRAYVPAKPNMFSAIDPSNIISLLSRFRIQDPTLVYKARKNFTIIFQEFLGAWVKQCLFISPSGMANQSSLSESQSLRMSCRVLIRDKYACVTGPRIMQADVFSMGACLVESPEVPRMLSFPMRSSWSSVASAFRKTHSDRSVGDQP